MQVKEAHRDENGKLLGFFVHKYIPKGQQVSLPPRPGRTAAPAPTPRSLPPGTIMVPKIFYAKNLGRYITRQTCLKCEQRHAACQCWPPFDLRTEVELVSGDAPMPRSTLEEVVKIQQQRGTVPGGVVSTSPLQSVTRGQEHGVPEPPKTLEEVVKIQRATGILR